MQDLTDGTDSDSEFAYPNTHPDEYLGIERAGH